jgi:hypothetical protein
VKNVTANRRSQLQYLCRVGYIIWSGEQTATIPNENAGKWRFAIRCGRDVASYPPY